MNKLRTLPVFDLLGTDFVVDIERQVLREAERPDNEISFIDHMRDTGSGYILRYDPVTRQPEAERAGHTIEETAIPYMTQLDPAGMSLKYGVPIEQVTGKSDFEMIVDQEAYRLRQQGVLPQIDIAGERFTIDLRLQELRHTKYFFPVLSLHSFELTDDGWHYLAFYEPIMKQVVTIDPKLTEFPDGILQIKIPNELGLDPVGAARIYGITERDLLLRFPIQKELKAELIPLSETGIPRLIQQNKDELRRQHAENLRKVKPRQRPRF